LQIRGIWYNQGSDAWSSITVEIRQAKLDDTLAISTLFRARIPTWQRLCADGRVEDVPYAALTIYERWLHGGPWMSSETGAIHLSHLLRGAALPLVAEAQGRIVAYTELYAGNEPEPFSKHLSMSAPVLDPEFSQAEEALLTAAHDEAAQRGYKRVLAEASLPERQAFYAQRGMEPLAVMRRYSLAAKTGQGFYKTVPHLDPAPKQIEGWHMSVGRLASARQQWETLWPTTWNAIPEIRQRKTHRLKLDASGQEALVCCQQQLYNERNADIYCWSPRPLTSQLLTAIRDWCHREGYRTLVFVVPEPIAKILGTEAESDGFSQAVYGLKVGG
jgi:hypothetical protein